MTLEKGAACGPENLRTMNCNKVQMLDDKSEPERELHLVSSTSTEYLVPKPYVYEV